MTETPVVFGLEPQDQRTHAERIYDLENRDMLTTDMRVVPDPFREPERTPYADKDQPDDKRWPYSLRAKSFHEDRMKQPGEVVWLLPHEVGPHHLVQKHLLPEEKLEPEAKAEAKAE